MASKSTVLNNLRNALRKSALAFTLPIGWLPLERAMTIVYLLVRERRIGLVMEEFGVAPRLWQNAQQSAAQFAG